MAKRKLAVALPVILVGTAGVAALAAAQPPASLPPGLGLDLINERCAFCHTTAQTLDVRKTPDSWAVTVQSMIDRGADLTPEEQDVMVDYLAKNLALENAPSPQDGTEGGAPQSMKP